MLKQHSFSNPFSGIKEKFQKSGRSNSAPGAYDIYIDRFLNVSNCIVASNHASLVSFKILILDPNIFVQKNGTRFCAFGSTKIFSFSHVVSHPTKCMLLFFAKYRLLAGLLYYDNHEKFGLEIEALFLFSFLFKAYSRSGIFEH